MVLRRQQLAFLVFVVTCVPILPGRCQPANASEYPDALISHPNAKDVRFGKVEATDQLTYHVAAKFPASGVIGWISYQLAKKGWEAQTHDFLNPQLLSSQVQGWQDFTDATKPTEMRVHQWIGDWKDKSGNVVRYVFRYTYPSDGVPNLTNLRVTGIYISAPVVRQELEELKTLTKELKAKKAK